MRVSSISKGRVELTTKDGRVIYLTRDDVNALMDQLASYLKLRYSCVCGVCLNCRLDPTRTKSVYVRSGLINLYDALRESDKCDLPSSEP